MRKVCGRVEVQAIEKQARLELKEKFLPLLSSYLEKKGDIDKEKLYCEMDSIHGNIRNTVFDIKSIGDHIEQILNDCYQRGWSNKQFQQYVREDIEALIAEIEKIAI